MASNKKAPIKKAQAKVVKPTVVKKAPKAIEPLKGKDKPTKKEPCDTVVAIKKADQQQVKLVRKKPLLSDEVVSVHAEKQVEEVKEVAETVKEVKTEQSIAEPAKQNTLPAPLLEAPKPTVLTRAKAIHHPNVLQQQPEFKSLISEDSEVKEDVPQHKHEDLFKAEKREHGSPLPF